MGDRLMRWTCVAGAILLGACYSSGSADDDGTADAGRDDGAGDVVREDAAGDDAVAPDDAPIDTAACTAPQHWVSRTLEIERLEDVSDGTVVDGQPVRVGAWVDLGPPGCLELGRISVDDDPATMVATVLVEGWTNEDALAGACPPAEPTMVFAVFRDLGPGTWTIQDGSAGPAGDPVTMTKEVIGCGVGCGCEPGPVVPLGGECTWNCDCSMGLECIGYYTIAGATARACYATCNRDADCRSFEECVSWDDGPMAVCQPRTEYECDPLAADCAPGFICDCGDGEGIPCTCDPTMPVDGGPCCRGSDCAPGQDCVQLGEEASFCAVRCVGRLDCPAGSFCGEVAPDSGICLSYE